MRVTGRAGIPKNPGYFFQGMLLTAGNLLLPCGGMAKVNALSLTAFMLTTSSGWRYGT